MKTAIIVLTLKLTGEPWSLDQTELSIVERYTKRCLITCDRFMKRDVSFKNDSCELKVDKKLRNDGGFHYSSSCKIVLK